MFTMNNNLWDQSRRIVKPLESASLLFRLLLLFFAKLSGDEVGWGRGGDSREGTGHGRGQIDFGICSHTTLSVQLLDTV